jgi:hypothetical protein
MLLAVDVRREVVLKGDMAGIKKEPPLELVSESFADDGFPLVLTLPISLQISGKMLIQTKKLQ